MRLPDCNRADSRSGSALHEKKFEFALGLGQNVRTKAPSRCFASSGLGLCGGHGSLAEAAADRVSEFAVCIKSTTFSRSSGSHYSCETVSRAAGN